MKLKKGKKGWVTTKMDLEKAYDRLKWSFIQEILEDMHLSSQLVQVIMRCVTTELLSIL